MFKFGDRYHVCIYTAMHDSKSISFTHVLPICPPKVFWEQQGIQTFGHKIQITRPQLASQPAFERHFAQLLQEYGAVHAINLLGSKDNEVVLAQAYSQHLKATELGASDSVDMGITNFDFHGQVRVGGHDSVPRELRRLDSIRNGIEKFGFTTAAFGSNELLTEQRGVFRTNCLDCLDRTNFVQDILSRVILEQFCFNIRREWNNSIHLWNYHRELWAENGDALSKIYAGTGALNTSFTRTGKRTLAGVLSDATKSVSRAYINNFQDKGKQTAIDMFLGNLSTQRQVTIFDPIHDSVRAALEARKAEYSTTKESTIFVGTYNLNGRPPSPESILPWLFPDPNGPEPDMMVLGFQEIVPLTAQQIVQTDPEKMVRWERKIMDTLSKRESKTQYLILRSEQLVGTALIVVVKSELTTVIRNVEAATRKTGLRGMSGNKGAVAIRLNYHDTSFCFLTAHLAAGHVNVDERNSDYRTISENLHFSKNRHIEDHENVIWAGDTNYRIDLDYDTAKSLAAANQLGQLLKYDQLIEAMQTGMAFGGYKERIPNFKPTYRYDLHSDEYDTSEKRRVPAWTDRIIFRGDELKNTVYSRAELRSSDHRPVYAIFKTQVLIIDSEKRNALQQDLLSSLTATEPGQKLDDKLMALTLESPSADDLPPPSSEDFAWWDGPGHPEGVFPPSSTIPSSGSNNPFDSDVTSTCSSDEELYRESSALQPPIQPRKPPPPPPPTRKPVVVVANADKE
ncbi:inositol polyphosphate 5-phosphatase [Tulasnella sp. 419]|nr:inositol polyphosphate 5-phosphatase [Tulasnella sp. 419]